MYVVKVVCGIIWKGDTIFIARRKQEKALGGYWEFPGGKIEEGEDPEIALLRELKEELGMDVTIGEFIGRNIHHYESTSIELIAYECKFISATFELTDHVEWRFVNNSELQNFLLAPADLFLIDKITLNRNKAPRMQNKPNIY